MDFRHFTRYHKSYLAFFGIIIATVLALDAYVLFKKRQYESETERLRAGMTDVERRKTDLALATEERRYEVMLALVRRQARIDKRIHLAVSVDTGRMHLEREGAVLRTIPVQIGPERSVGLAPDTVVMATARGERTIEQVLGEGDAWRIPEWVYTDRGLPVPVDRALKGALGDVAILLNGGTVIYSLPSVGPLNDANYLMPGSLRASAADLKAIAPNLKPGTPVYFY
ncbi:MAG: hypothetical protein M3373_13880 [Gemmatimonadota bacterium]|nr:hypothetical protein [Gemmatimonadota bacterium]